MTLDEFRLSLDGVRYDTLARHGYGKRLTMQTKIVGGEAKYAKFIVEDKGEEVWSGENFSTATRRYWEIVYRDAPPATDGAIGATA